MKKILFSLFTIGIVGGAGFAATQAFFSDTETSAGNTFTAGELDLKIDNTSYLNRALYPGTTWALDDLTDHLFFNFNDLKPDDEGEDTISLHVQNDAYACMTIAKTEDDDESCTEPETTDDPTCNEPDSDLADGELGGLLNFVFWNDDGDNVLENNETVFKQGTAATLFDGTTWSLADSLSNIWAGAGGPILANQTYFIGKAWCFGTLTTAPVPAGQGVNPTVDSGVDCGGTALDNASQTDKFMADVEFSAVQSRHNPDFLCSGEPSPTPTPTPIACIETFASSASSNNQGTRKDGSAVLANRSVPSAMFGAPQTSGAPSDVGFPAGSFFSLGFTNGNIVVGFANPFFNQPGDDLQVFEVTGGVYPDEKVQVEVGSTALGPWTVVAAAAIRDESIDIGAAGVLSAQFVRLTDVSNIALFEPTADAYDVDAVKAFCGSSAD